ncbi:MAG: hypothetical protein GXP51_09490 [Deltaproteobacteria bacterium]|nr:hypothetical protein [Deltaproteobacteria bacterium]
MSRIDLPSERRVGHLTLHRHGRKLTIEEYNALTRGERLEMIHRARGKQKYDLLLNAVDAEQLTPQLHPQELYLLINELGPEYSVDLLTMASPDQITTLLDLDCWDGDTLSPMLTLHWLQLLLETGPEKVCQLARDIEPEILVIFLKKHLTIIRGLEAYDDDDAENANRMESIYDINFASEDAAKIIGAFLRILMELVQESYLLLMEMTRSELTTTLEEEVFQGRNHRLSDLGFVPSVEARGIYTFIDPEGFVPGGKRDFQLEAKALQNPGALLAQASPDNLLAELLSNGLNHELASELCLLANRKMSADGTDISTAAEVGGSLQELYDTLNLALEYLAGTDIDKAEQIINSSYLLHLFQLGHSLLKRARDSAQTILDSPIGPFLDYPEQLFLDALVEQPPVLYREACADKPSNLQSITTLKDLELVNLRLQQIKELQRLFCELLPFSLPADEEETATGFSLSVLFLTAVANQLLGRPFTPAAVSAEDPPRLKELTFAGNKLAPEFQNQLHALLTQLEVNCGFFVEFCLECWQEDLGGIDPGEPDTDYHLCLWVEK